MKTYKKIILGSGLLLFSLLSVGTYAKHVALASAAPSVTLGNDFKFIDQQHITGSINGNTVTFFDSKVDNTRNFQPQNMADPPWCNYGTSGNQRWGINISSSADLSAATIKATIGLGYENTVANSTKCTQIPAANFSPSSNLQIDGSAAQAELSWQGNNIVSSDGKDTYASTNVASVFIDQANLGSCEASGIIITSGPNKGTLYKLADISAPATKSLPDNLKQYLKSPGGCRLSSSKSVNIAGTQSSTGSGGGGGTTQANGGGGDACVVNAGGFSLTWILCPVLDAADSLASTLTNLFEGQLSFQVKDLSKNSGVNSVNAAWSLIRDIASAALVIILLIMVISQAIGGGPFDAYTIRKMLPKLVAAIILMQLSWPLLSYIVDIVNYLGEGLKQIMYLPFQPGNLDDFWALLSNAGIGTGGAAAASWVALVGIGIGVAIALPTLLMFCFVAIMSVLTGLAVLVFRKILIIMALIFAPIAILAWILPGTQSYYKLWRDNFTKALLMYPLAIGLVASGRIFAYVVGTTGNGTFLNFFLVMIGFFGPLFILPKTFKWGGSLMQSAGSAAFKASDKFSERPKKYFQARQENWSKERRAASQERVAAGAGLNPKAPWRFPLDKFRSGQWDPLLGKPRLRGGKGIPVPGTDKSILTEPSRMRSEKVAHYKKEGRDKYTEDLAAARIGEQIDWENMVEGGGITKDDYLQDVFEGKHSIDPKSGRLKDYRTFDGRKLNPLGKSRMERLAALYEMEKLAGGTNNRHILRAWEHAQAAGPDSEEYSDFRRFMSDSVGTLMPSLTDIYKGTDSTADAGPAGVAKQHGTETENMLATLTNRIKVETDPGKRAAAVKSLNTYLSSYLAAAESDTLRGNVELGATRAIKALVTDPNEVLVDSQGRQVTYNEDVHAPKRDNKGQLVLGPDGKPEQELIHKRGQPVTVRDSLLDPIYYDSEDGRASLGFKNAKLELDDDVIATIRPELRTRLDKIIRPEGGFVEADVIRASASGGQPQQQAAQTATARSAQPQTQAQVTAAAAAAAPGSTMPVGAGLIAQAGGIAQQEGAPAGPAGARGYGPIELQIDHEALGNTIMEASRRGTVEGMRHAARDLNLGGSQSFNTRRIGPIVNQPPDEGENPPADQPPPNGPNDNT